MLRRRDIVGVIGCSLLATVMAGECVLAKPLRVHQVCGQVTHLSYSLPSTLRLTLQEKASSGKALERQVSTDDEGNFAFKNLIPGKYELRVTPAGMSEVSVPVLVDLGKSKGRNCTEPMKLTLDYLPEACLSSQLQKRSK